MKKLKKLLVASVTGAIGGYLIASIAGFAKLLSLGRTVWEGHVSLGGLPVMHIKSDAHGFIAQTEYGVFVIALIGAVIASVSTLYATRTRKPLE